MSLALETRTPPYRRPLAAWLPFLWTEVLFPGRDPGREPVCGRALLWLLVLPGLLLYVCLSFQLFEPDEGRYAEIPREMLLRGDWTVPHLQGQPYLDKPPLLYWLVALSYRAFGVHDWSARLVPALAIHGCVLLTYFFGRRWFGERSAFWGALLLGLAPGFLSIGRLLVLDGLLAFWVTLSVFTAYEAVCTDRFRPGWWLLGAAACGLGVLTKGPIALLLLAVPVWAHRRLAGTGFPLGWRRVVLFIAVVTAVAAPWYVAICLKRPEFARYFLWQHNVQRFLAPFDHLEPIWYYVPLLVLGLLPGTLLTVPFLRFLTTGDAAATERRGPALGFVLLAGGWCVLFFSVSGSKLPTYVLPAFPPLCLAVGYFLAGSRWLTTRWPQAAVATMFGVLFLGHNIVLPWYAGYRGTVGPVPQVRELCADRATPVVCYPRSCDSVAFYVGRDDFQNFRSKETHLLVYFLQQHPRTVLLLTHRHSLEMLRYALTPDLQVTESHRLGLGSIPGLPGAVSQKLAGLLGETSLGLCDVVVIERKP